MKRDDLLDLNDALQHPGRTISVDISTEMPDESEVELLEPCAGYLEAVSTGNVLLLTGEFKARCIVDCARCGAPLEKEVVYEVDEQFPVEGTPSMFSQDDYAKIAAEEDYPLFEGNSLMVENLIHQGLVVNLPLQPLCQHGWDEPCPQAAAREAQRSSEAARPEFGKLANLKLPEGDSGE
ncbi:MAG: DUF177 domain-containing protein [Fimbriimonadaceae bacterium]|nr:DUF177 domain-containing protein [Fimbriimonadaceae bacterium]